MKHLNVRLLMANAVKSGRWVSHTFLQKHCSFKSFRILEENCGTDITNGTFKCKSFVGKCCKKRPLSKIYLPTKAKSFQSFLNSSIILKKFLCLEINDFGEINIWRSWWRRNVMRKKNSFTNQVVKDKIVFPLFFVKSHGFDI